ncbi:MAG: NAC family transcription factor [Methanomicrobiales archaeon]|nr:NAC family transcription factor [Methanomicrobiales archaeon]
MPENDKDGYYCSICGGIPPDKIKTKRILIDGKETGIENLEFIFGKVKELDPKGDGAAASMILARVKEFNYVPSKKERVYAEALLREYRRWEAEGDQNDR